MNAKVFNEYAREYDEWFDTHVAVYESEVEAVRRFVPKKGLGVEIGVGTGRFSVPFSISLGVDPSDPMAAIARPRGITVYQARAERLPFQSEHFHFALMITAICFVDNSRATLQEAHRILKLNGRIILAIIDKETQLGKTCESMKPSNKVYSHATLYSTQEVIQLLCQVSFNQIQSCETIFSNPERIVAPDPVKDGYGEGAFVVLTALKD